MRCYSPRYACSILISEFHSFTNNRFASRSCCYTYYSVSVFINQRISAATLKGTSEI